MNTDDTLGKSEKTRWWKAAVLGAKMLDLKGSMDGEEAHSTVRLLGPVCEMTPGSEVT